jgi:hypothetical protein
MGRIYVKAAIVLVAALALVAGASAASPNVAAMNLQAADVPGAKVVSQRAVKEMGYSAAYVRTFRFSVPSGSSRLVGVAAETKLAPSASVAASDVSVVEKAFRSTSGRKLFIATIAQGANVKPKAVILGAFRKVAGYDQGFEVPVSVLVKGKRYYENLVYMRLDRVAVFMAEAGLRPITAGATGKFAIAIAGHIGTELAPILVSPPTVTGTAQQGQTLTATPGTWTAPDATFTYQWQHCDAAGANCVDIAGATTQTYAVTPADAGTTLVVVVTASNRFGALPAPSAATLAVS